MQALKALVVLMGVLIVAGAGIIAVTIYNRLSGPTGPETPAPAAAAAKPKGFDVTRLGLPRGAELRGMEAAGTRLLLHVHIPGRGARVYIVHLETGALLGTVEVTGAE